MIVGGGRDALYVETVTPGSVPNLADYDVVLGNSSAGKDSQAMLDVVVEAARAADVLDRLVVVHADLGDNEWPGTAQLAAEHAAQYGLRFEIVSRQQDDGEVETILRRVSARGMWPDAARRWCTSDHKRGPIRKLMTQLAAEQRAAGIVGRPVRILNVMGFRAEESPARRGRVPYSFDGSASNGRRHVDTWLPIHGWTTAQVWQRIEQAGTRPHPAYAAGMSRLSCRFCVLASRADLICSARVNPELAERYAAVEAETGHRFRKDLSMAEIIAAAQCNDADQRAEQVALFDRPQF